MAREAMNSLDAVTDLHMSGRRAVFQLEDGAKLSKTELAAAFQEAGLKLESFQKSRQPLPERLYLVDAGIT